MITEKLSRMIAWIIANQDMIAMFVAVVYPCFEAYRANQVKTARDMVLLCFNTLKDEKKMAEGVAFSAECVAKAKEMGRLMGMNPADIQTVVKELEATNTVVKTSESAVVIPGPAVSSGTASPVNQIVSGLMPNGVKIASIKGTPIYIGPTWITTLLSRWVKI